MVTPSVDESATRQAVQEFSAAWTKSRSKAAFSIDQWIFGRNERGSAESCPKIACLNIRDNCARV